MLDVLITLMCDAVMSKMMRSYENFTCGVQHLYQDWLSHCCKLTKESELRLGQKSDLTTFQNFNLEQPAVDEKNSHKKCFSTHLAEGLQKKIKCFFLNLFIFAMTSFIVQCNTFM